MSGDPIRRDIIDNTTDGITMQKILSSEIPRVTRFDVSTGYFDVAGYGMLRGSLEPAAKDGSFEMRMLLGKEAILPPAGSFERYAEQYRQASGGTEPDSSAPLKSSLDEADLEPESLASISGLIELLGRPNVQVRLGASRFNHSKCYILGGSSAFIGSSNFTAGGMVGNHELNAGLYQPGVAESTRKWFDRMWDGATDAKEEMIGVLKQSKFGMPPGPYDVYMKMLYEKFEPFLKQDDRPRRRDVQLASFQQDAVSTAMHVISNHGGAIIADSTGLGKTNMGIEVIRQKILDEGRKVMLVAPAQVLRGMWEEKLKDVDISVRRMVTMESMGRADFLEDRRKYRNIDFIVVDESQNFRSKTARRRLNLMSLLSVGRRKQVLLLTATPINNSLMDLYYQLSIVTGGDDQYFWDTAGITDLHKHMRDATNRDLQRGLEKIQQLLDAVMIRRTRSFIREVYPDDAIRGQPVRFPEHEYRPIRYDLAGIFGNVFGRLFEDIESLTMAPYGVERYNTSLSAKDREAHRVLARLQVILLLKRFESSVEAVRISIANKVRMYEHVERTLRGGRILRVGDFNRALAQWNNQELDSEGEDEEEREERFVKEVEALATEKAGKEYDVRSLLGDIRADLDRLRNLQKEIERITVDTKFDAVAKTILAERALESGGGKVLVFTEYAATAKYVHKRLKEVFPGREVLLIHGGTKPETRKAHVQRFSPGANLPEDEDLDGKEADILVSTEVLAEGQNLQDCNYVVNYDLPWNPMRIVQRTGRIDRLTTRHGTVHSRACYPDKQLDDLLRLVGRLLEKIDTAAEVVGTDTVILGRMPSYKTYNGRLAQDIRVLGGLDGGGIREVTERLESESDMMVPTTPINEIIRHVKEIGLDAMKGVPLGRRSGRRGEGRKAVLAYLQDGQVRRVHFVVYDYATDKAEVPDTDTDAIRLASCAKTTPLHLPMDGEEHRESFEELLRIDKLARQTVLDRDRDGRRRVADLQRKKRQHDKNTSKLVSELVMAAMDGRITHEEAEKARLVLESAQMRSWPAKSREFLEEYRAGKDPAALAGRVRKFADSIYLEDARDERTAKGEDAKLKLVGAIFVMEEFDPRQGRKGLERYGD